MKPAGEKSIRTPSVTICVLTYGDYAWLARRCIESVRANCVRQHYRLVVGANAVGPETLSYLQALHQGGEIDRLVVSDSNLNKCPMMRRMFEEIDTEFIWWFDDDSYIREPTALADWLAQATAAPESTVMWGSMYVCESRGSFTDIPEVNRFVRSASWFRGLTPPGWRPGG